MAKDRIVRTTRTEVERLPAKDGDPIAGRLREVMQGFAQLTVAGYVEAFWSAMSEDTTARIDVFKRLAGQFMKKGELVFQQMDPDDVEGFMVATWGPGVYQFRPMIGKKYYSPVSVPYKIGDTGEDEKGSGQGGDGLEELVGKLAVAKQLKELREGLVAGEKGDDGMKAAEVQAMMQATLAPLQTMLDATARRAEQAEQRNHELQLKLLDMAQGRQQSAQGSIAELVKLMPKEALAALLSPADTPGWAEKAVDALREFGPALAQMLMEYFRPGAGRLALPAGSEGQPQQEPQPTETVAAGSGGGNRPMPIQLNPEQLEAKKLLLDCIRERDFDNAYAMVQNFPGFTPTANGPMPIGDAFLSMVDPKVTRPRIYVIQMMQLVPELAQMLDAADAFISHIQKKIMADQEAFIREQNGRRGGAVTDPRPTTGEDER